MIVARGVLIVGVADETVELSPTEWVEAQTRKILEAGTTEGIDVLGSPIVLLRLRGAKTGKLRYTPVMRVEHDGKYALVASKGGAPSHPAWYHNLVANPRVTVEVGTETYEADAKVLTGEERDRQFVRQVEAMPNFGDYQRRTTRVIPVVALERVG
jgi:deazaflavin-dependent oxidoreductase (nitroreductase family)